MTNRTTSKNAASKSSAAKGRTRKLPPGVAGWSEFTGRYVQMPRSKQGKYSIDDFRRILREAREKTLKEGEKS